ncbi:hypothetical protein [Chryseobacterium carnipullorum]|uniref:hypothetical protein n=1 Tax=Chryseobacterium carnipullorum TaxID=1124835 RepID=UPI001114CE56|nr:hypothetical protein [Chryseobacterium carnipullorum]
MKNIFKIIINSIIILGSGLISAQVGDYSIQKKNIVAFPTSANAYAMDKVGKLPVDMFRGKANINIPFYAVNVDGVNIPISLSYNTGGIKLNEVASTAGLGWSLSIPNSINQNILDKDDKSSSMYTKNINTVLSKLVDISMYENELRQVVVDHYEGIYDTRPDMFNYSLPFGGGSFIFNNDTGHTIPHEDLVITATNNKKNIKIVNTEGTSYFLSIKNSTLVNSGVPGDMGSGSQTLYQVDSIRTANNKKILFEYAKSYSYEEKSITEKVNIDITKNVMTDVNLPPSLPEYERYTGSAASMEKLITKIIFPDGTVYFNYSNDGLPFSDGTTIRKDLSGNNGIALRQIIVKDNYGKIIKNYHLNYSYFTSNTGTDFQNYRLKLVDVYDDLQNSYYKFYYNESIPFPARNSNNDDYWGYINSTNSSEDSYNLPHQIYTDYVPANENVSIKPQYTRNRDTNPAYTQIGILNRIEYPTGGSKNLYYENANKFFNKTNYQWGYLDNFATVLSAPTGAGGFTDDFGNVNQTVTIPQSFFDGKLAPKIKLTFGNTCENNVDDETSQIHETSCYGNAIAGGQPYGTNGKPAVFEVSPSNNSFNISLSRQGKCQCGYAIDVVYGKNNTINSNVPIGGLRIKRIEDKNESSIVNAYNYKYDIFDPVTNTNKSSGVLNIPFQYTRLLKRYSELTNEGIEIYPPYVQKYLVINNSSTSYNTYGSSDVITYKQVTEYNDLGENINIFSKVNNSDSDKMYTHIYSNYDDWKNGLLEKNIVLNKLGDTLRVQTNKYAFNNLKNPKAGFITGDPNQMGFALNLDIVKYPKRITSSTHETIYGQIYLVNKEILSINSGKVENTESKTKEYFPGNKVIETVTKSNFNDTDINKPINVKTVSVKTSNNTVTETSYQYAHEKGNQLMISKNMIGIPLETSTTQTIGNTTKTLSRTETLYPKTTTEITNNNSSLVLPLSVLSYEVQNNTPSTEVTYDKYDNKGNLQQYTARNGISTTIIWGYNQTQPIAKVEGAKLSDIPQALIDNIVNASVNDNQFSTEASEQSLISALDVFRNNAALSAYQISTYSYDPLIGVKSITPPSGIREFYFYDTANRLKEVRENSPTGKILKEYKYNYKN